MKKIPVTIWTGCYARQWSGALIPDAFKHPAKFSRSLVERILEYGIEKGYWAPGMRLGDPFGGVGTGAVAAADRGFEWIGQELEEQFVEIGNRNIDSHREKWARTGRPIPILVKGDSRKFAETVAGIVTSPPFQHTPGGARGIMVKGYNGRPDLPPDFLDKRHFKGEGGDREANNIEKLRPGSLDGAVTSPPYETISAGAGGLNTKPAKKEGQQSGRKGGGSQGVDQRYGSGAGQIAKLKKAPLDAALTSPPHGNTMRGQRDGIDWDKAKREKSGGGEHQKRGKSLRNDPANIGKLGGVLTSPPYGESNQDYVEGAKTIDWEKGKRKNDQLAKAAYGDSEANISKLGGVVTSPPYERNRAKGHIGADAWSDPKRAAEHMSAHGKGHSASSEARQRQFERDAGKSYGESEGQIGREAGETYWMAMKKVYTSTFECLKPGGYAAVVVKDYVRNWKRVPLCDDTLRLLVHVGFEPIERIHAMVVEETTHEDLFEGTVTTKKERKSFFRRLQEKRGSPAIDFEEVLIVRKPCKPETSR